MTLNSNIDRIKKFLKNHNNFLITAHTSPEGDSLGSQLAFAIALRSMGKNYQIINSDKYSKEYMFLPGVDKIKTNSKIKTFDAAIILDCADISRIGNVVNILRRDMPILNIDHHISNSYFGDINLVDTKASSACQILYTLFKRLRVKFDKRIAICLYTGIAVDTGSFRYTNTTATTHFVASQLLKYDINASEIYRNIYENLNFSELKLINSALLNIRMDKTGKIAWVKVTQEMLTRYRPQIDLTDNLLNFLRSIRAVEVCVLFKEGIGQGKHIRVNLRSRGTIDVNKIAQHFGGGGHKTASGVTLRGLSLKSAEAKIINFIKNRISKIR